MNPSVTIAIPTFSRLYYLKEALESGIEQHYDNIEILIGDDGTSELIRQWGTGVASGDSRIKYRRNHRNLGIAGNWNSLADAASGEFIVIIGDDDRLLPDFVSVLVGAIQPFGQVAFSNHYLIDAQGQRLEAASVEWTHLYGRDRIPEGKLANPAVHVWQNAIPLSAALLRTRDVQRLRFKEDLDTPEVEFFARLAEEGGSFVFVPIYLSEYRTHSNSATSAGTHAERLIKYLEPIMVNTCAEPYKRKFIGSLLSNAVAKCLRENNPETARILIHRPYYPSVTWRYLLLLCLHKLIRRCGGQAATPSVRTCIAAYLRKLCAEAPFALGGTLFRLMSSLKRGVRWRRYEIIRVASLVREKGTCNTL
jgi:glycosyltransferase involved in cell wall biosynthesis